MRKLSLFAMSLALLGLGANAAELPISGQKYNIVHFASALNACQNGSGMVIQTPDAGDPNQEFLFTEISDGVWSIQAADGMYVGSDGKWTIKYFANANDQMAQFKILDQGDYLYLHIVGMGSKGLGTDGTSPGDKVYTDKGSGEKRRWTLESTSRVKPTSIEISQTSLQMKVNESATLEYTLAPADAVARVKWTSSNPDVAAVDANGKVWAYSEGKANITASADGLTAVCAVTVAGVAEKHPELPDDHPHKWNELFNGDFETEGVVQSHPADWDWDEVLNVMAATEIPHWNLVNLDPWNVNIGVYSKIEDDNDHFIRLVGAPNAGWMETSMYQEATLEIGKDYEFSYDYNSVHPYRPTKVTLAAVNADGSIGNKIYECTHDTEAEGWQVAWTQFTARSTKVRLTIAMDNWWASNNDGEKESQFDNFLIVSKDKVVSDGLKITMSQPTLEMKVNETATLTYTLEPADANPQIIWSSVDPSIADVDKKGNVTAYSEGTTTIKVSANGTTDQCVVTVAGVENKHPELPDDHPHKWNELFNGDFETEGVVQSHPEDWDWEEVLNVMAATEIPHWNLVNLDPWNVNIGVYSKIEDENDHFIRLVGAPNAGWMETSMYQEATIQPGKDYEFSYDFNSVHPYRPTKVTLAAINEDGSIGNKIYECTHDTEAEGWQVAWTQFTARCTKVRLTIAMDNWWASNNDGEKESQFDNFLLIDKEHVQNNGLTITLSESALEMKVNETATLTYSLEPADATAQIIWSSTNPAVASVDNKGNVTAISEGKTLIKVSANGTSAQCAVTVAGFADKHPELDADHYHKYNELFNGDFETEGVVQSHPADWDWAGVENVMAATEIPHWTLANLDIWNVNIGVYSKVENENDHFIRLVGAPNAGWMETSMRQDATVQPETEYVFAYDYNSVHPYRPTKVTLTAMNVDGTTGAKLYERTHDTEGEGWQREWVELNTTTHLVRLTVSMDNWWASNNDGEKESQFDNFLLVMKSLAPESSIATINTDDNAPIEYYNLQGIRVANPANGIYIMRQGNKATKVLIK